MVVDSEGNEVRRHRERPPAGRATRSTASAGTGATTTAAVVPDGIYRMRVVRRDESRVIDSVKEITRGHACRRTATLVVGQAVRDRHRRCRARRRASRSRYRGPTNQAPGVPRVPHRRRQAARRAGASAAGPTARAVWDGQVSDRARAHRAGARGRLRLHRPPCATGPATSTEAPAPDRRPRAWRGPAPASRCAASPCAARCPPSPPARWPTSRSARSTAASTSSCRASAIPKPLLHGGRVAGRFRIRIPSKTRTGVYVVRVRAGRRARRLAARGGRACRRAARRGEARPLVVLPALTWQGLNRVDDDVDGFADRLPFAQVGPARPPVRGRRRCRRASTPRCRRCCAGSIASGSPYDLTTDLALARREGPALGNAPGRGVRRQRAVAARASC